MLAGSDISVVQGSNGWNLLNSFKGNSYLSEAADLSHWKKTVLPGHLANYQARANRMRVRGIPFVVMFAPEASGIYGEFLPPSITIEYPTACEILSEKLIKEGVNVVCPSAALRKAKGPLNLYQKVDSHWSHAGAYIAYVQLLTALGPDYRARAVPWQSIFYQSQKGFGDLGVHTVPEMSDYIQSVDIPAYVVESGKNIFDNREKNVRKYKFGGGHQRALIFRDSFANALSPYFERTFAESILVAPAPTMMDDAIDHFDPDLVILEVAERALFVAESPLADWSVRSFAQEYLEQNSNPTGGRLEVQAVTALISGDVEQALALAATATALEEDFPRLYNLAWILNHSGRDDLCLAVARQALSSRRDTFLQYLESRSLAALGNLEGAVRAIRLALQLKPDNAWILCNLGDWLAQLGEIDEAIAVLDKAASLAPLHAPVWELLETLAIKRSDNARLTTVRERRASIFPAIGQIAT